jgi:hypothetical protein
MAVMFAPSPLRMSNNTGKVNQSRRFPKTVKKKKMLIASNKKTLSRGGVSYFMYLPTVEKIPAVSVKA